MANKELKNEIIEYFISEYYSKFSNLCEKISIDEIKRRLDKNIKKVITNKKSLIYLGRYYIINKKIIIYNKNITNKDLEIKDVQDNLKLKTVMLHEFTHALFRRNPLTTGCFTINLGISMFKNYPKNVVKCRGLNEGYTNWISEKSGLRTNSYRLETSIINELEICLGADKVLEIGLEKNKNIYKVLEITKKDFKMFYRMLDDVNSLDLKILKKIKKRKGKNIIEKIKKLQEKRTKNAIQIQNFVFEKFIKSYLEREKSNIVKLYTIMLEYQKYIGSSEESDALKIVREKNDKS